MHKNIVVKRILVMQWADFPEQIRKKMQKWFGFCDKATLRPQSELGLTINDYKKGLEILRRKKIENDFSGTLDDFVLKYGLEFDKFVIDNFDVKEIDDIIIEVHWEPTWTN